MGFLQGEQCGISGNEGVKGWGFCAGLEFLEPKHFESGAGKCGITGFTGTGWQGLGLGAEGLGVVSRSKEFLYSPSILIKYPK